MQSHFDEAVKTGAVILIGGDFFCAMQGKYDRRSNKSDIRPEHANGDYLDSLVSTAADWLKPYAKNIALICQGNHESAVHKNHETDLTGRLVERIKTICPESPVSKGGYSGWVRVSIEHKTCSGSRVIWYHHGSGGGGPVTKGVIQTNRRNAYVSGADVFWHQHIHEQFCMETPKISLFNGTTPRIDECIHVCTPGYKEEYADGFDGWHNERSAPPKPVGGYWLDFVASRAIKQGDRHFTISVSERRAK